MTQVVRRKKNKVNQYKLLYINSTFLGNSIFKFNAFLLFNLKPRQKKMVKLKTPNMENYSQ